jgi:hypothetical protein
LLLLLLPLPLLLLSACTLVEVADPCAWRWAVLH